MSNKQKTAGGFSALIAAIAIVIALVIGIVIYMFIFGNPANFVDNDPTKADEVSSRMSFIDEEDVRNKKK
jgi:uncharacterized membrane protein YqhA